MNKHLPGVQPRSVQLTPEQREDLGRRATESDPQTRAALPRLADTVPDASPVTTLWLVGVLGLVVASVLVAVGAVLALEYRSNLPPEIVSKETIFVADVPIEEAPAAPAPVPSSEDAPVRSVGTTARALTVPVPSPPPPTATAPPTELAASPPVERSEPAPAGCPATRGHVRASGDARVVWLEREDQKVLLPGCAPSGAWTIRADFGAGPEVAGKLGVEAGEEVVLACTAGFRQCKR